MLVGTSSYSFAGGPVRTISDPESYIGDSIRLVETTDSTYSDRLMANSLTVRCVP